MGSTRAQSPPGPDLFQTLYTTRSLRRFEDTPVSDAVLFQILDAAIRAPCGQNAQDWRFIIVRDPTVKRRLAHWSRIRWARYQPEFAARPERMDTLPRTERLSLRSVAHLVEHFERVPVLIVVCGLANRHSRPDGSTYPAVQNMLLAARALGLGGCIFNLALGDSAELMQTLSIPESNEIRCLVPLGYPADRPGPVQRKPLREVVHAERFGAEWAFASQQPDAGWQSKWVDPER